MTSQIDSATNAALPSAGQVCCDDEWEDAYRRFETPEEEIRKFCRRLQKLGCGAWGPEARIADLFCGRGNGLRALKRLGFHNVHGVDLSATLLKEYDGEFATHVADCRHLPFDDATFDVVMVQGGLHHLPTLPEDLDQVLAEMTRVLKPGGRAVIVEPWQTWFLSGVHFLSEMAWLRRIWPKLDAFYSMVCHERTTYEQWLKAPREILQLLEQRFEVEQMSRGWGKLSFVGHPRRSVSAGA